VVTETAPGPEHRLMDGVRVQFQLAGQSGWCSPPCQTQKHRALPGSEVRIHPLQDHPGEITRLGLEVGARVRRRKFLPRLRRERRTRAAPAHVLGQLGGHLVDDEPSGPGREPALAAKVTDLADDEEQGVRCGLAGEIVEVRAGNAQAEASLARLALGSAQQDLVEFLAGSLVQCARAGQALEPLLIIVDVSKPRPSDITVNVSSKSIRGEVLRILAGVDGEIRRFIAQYVKDEIDSPASQAAQIIDIATQVDTAWPGG